MTPNRVDVLRSELEKFKTSFEALVPRNPALLRKSPIYLAVQRKLRQSGVFDISPLDILYDVWLLGVQSIERGKPIQKPDAWVYTVALRVIARKIPKKGKHHHFVEYDSVTDEHIALDNSDETEYGDARSSLHQKVRQAWLHLDTQDREILESVLLDNRSYADLAKCQVQKGERPVEPTTLRQRKSRAMKKLKELYHRLG
jgi:DNA-directed RNA polymerase specialized sigma24 family protein